MINLTENAITLIDKSGEAITIPASGYVARVEASKRTREHFSFAQHADDALPSARMAEDIRCSVPIIEETPTDIVFARPHTESILTSECFLGDIMKGNVAAFFLVAREVAEAARVIRHPLADRMVWVDDGKFGIVNHDDGKFSSRQAWRSLRRVARGDSK